jgi:hypothetical protein
MKLKKGVLINGLKPEMVLGLMIIESVFNKHGKEFVITEVTGGKHGRASLHYVGYAVDIRTRNFTSEDIEVLARDVREALGENYDIIIESTHIHVEYQPK